jgi:cell wall-associated NlpC family hydrolase
MLPNEIVNKYLGTKYVYRGRVAWLDCYGLVWRIYKDLGVDIPDLSFSDDPRWHMVGKNLDVSLLAEIFEKRSEPKLYDLVAVKNPKGIVNHAGIYIGAGQFIHATKQAGCVCSLIHVSPWKETIVGFYRHKGLK